MIKQVSIVNILTIRNKLNLIKNIKSQIHTFRQIYRAYYYVSTNLKSQVLAWTNSVYTQKRFLFALLPTLLTLTSLCDPTSYPLESSYPYNPILHKKAVQRVQSVGELDGVPTDGCIF